MIRLELIITSSCPSVWNNLHETLKSSFFAYIKTNDKGNLLNILLYFNALDYSLTKKEVSQPLLKKPSSLSFLCFLHLATNVWNSG